MTNDRAGTESRGVYVVERGTNNGSVAIDKPGIDELQLPTISQLVFFWLNFEQTENMNEYCQSVSSGREGIINVVTDGALVLDKSNRQ